MVKIKDYLKEQFKDDDYVKEYINAALELYFEDHNKELFLASLKGIIQAKGGIAEFSKHAHINRQYIYKILSNKENPTIDNISLILSALGLKLQVNSINNHS
jgi:probable addiction module antidote protein